MPSQVKWPLCLGIALVLLGVGVLWWSSRERNPPSQPDPLSGGEKVADAPDKTGPARTTAKVRDPEKIPDPAPPTKPIEDPSSPILTVVVVDASTKKPLEGAEVSALSASEIGAHRSVVLPSPKADLSELETTSSAVFGDPVSTDENGVARLVDLPIGAPIYLTARLPEYASAFASTKAFAGERKEIALASPARVFGSIRDADGNNLPDSRVKFSRPRRSYELDTSGGVFDLSGLAPGSWLVTAAAPGRAGEFRQLKLESGAEVSIEFELSEGLTLEGLVVDYSTNAPIGGIEISSSDTFDAAKTDEAGNFKISNLPKYTSLSFRGGKYDSSIPITSHKGTWSKTVFHLAKSRSVGLELTWHDQSPVVNGEVKMYFPAMVSIQLSGSTDERGIFGVLTADVQFRASRRAVP